MSQVSPTTPTPIEPCSVTRAVWIGLAWVNGPVLLLLFLPAWTFGELVERGIVSRQYNGFGILVFVGGFALAWTWWSLSVPRWRIWAYERVANRRALMAEAVSYGLTWPDGSWFAKTEIKSAELRRREAHLDPRFSLRPAGSGDVSFVHDLSRENMEATFEAAGITWDPALIPATWSSTDNFLLYNHGERIGVLRLRHDDDALYVSDLQVVSGHRDLGAGSCALRFAADRAEAADLSRLRLRVFRDSRAVALYRRSGFEVVVDEGAKLLMEKRLES